MGLVPLVHYLLNKMFHISRSRYLNHCQKPESIWVGVLLLLPAHHYNLLAQDLDVVLLGHYYPQNVDCIYKCLWLIGTIYMIVNKNNILAAVRIKESQKELLHKSIGLVFQSEE